MKKSQSSDYMTRLEKTLAIDDEGNATFAKSVLADGTIGGNSGLKAIKVYNYVGYTVEIYAEKANTEFENCFSFIGAVDSYFAIGSYEIENGIVTHLRFLAIDPSEFAEFIDDDYFQIAINDHTQQKLFTHTLILTADKSYTLVYQSTKDLAVNSIADLRTIMNVTATTDNVILPLCATDLSGTAVLQVTTTLCKIGAANVTAVADKITEL